MFLVHTLLGLFNLRSDIVFADRSICCFHANDVGTISKKIIETRIHKYVRMFQDV